MVSPRLRLGLALLALTLLVALPAHATTYLFEVPSMTVDLWPETDGDLRVRYAIVFKNLSQDPLDIVDIGTPDKNFRLDSFHAVINGRSLPTVRKSEYVTGVEVPLTGHEIKQNQRKTFTIEFTHPGMVWNDRDDDSYTSVEFGNTYFGDKFVRGTTDLTVRWHFPPGITANETKWHRDKPEKIYTTGNHLVFTYHRPSAPIDRMTKFGIGFPARVMEEGTIRRWSFSEGCLNVVAAFFALMATILPIAFVLLMIVGPIVFAHLWRRRRMKHYLPPAIGVEGAGPKRGLTAPEAAVVMELPPDRVLMMIAFGLVKKGALHITEGPKRLKFHAQTPLPKGLRRYELRFLEAIKKDHELSERRLRSLFIDFVKSVNQRLKGFSRKDTRQYYRRIVEEAWRQVEAADTPKLGDAFADRLEWLAVDDDFAKRSTTVFAERPVVHLPVWWGHHWAGPTHSPASGAGLSMSGADLAHQFTTAVTDFSSNAVASISDFTASITQATNPPPVRTSSGGGGSGCACACAGCACACAGGGR